MVITVPSERFPVSVELTVRNLVFNPNRGLSKAKVLGLGKVSYTAFYPVAYSCSIWVAARETRRVVKTYDQPMRKLLFEPVLANLHTRDPNAFEPMTLHQAEAMLNRAADRIMKDVAHEQKTTRLRMPVPKAE